MLTCNVADLGRSRTPSPNRPDVSNVKNQMSQGPKAVNQEENTYMIKRNADNMLRQNHTTGLHELVLEQISRIEALMQDNALMQRQQYKYETTLSELDVILRNDQRDKQVFELKKLVENQLKQIVNLQREAETTRTLNHPAQANTVQNQRSHSKNGHGTQQSNLADQKENEKLKFQIAEMQTANNELI